MTANARTTVIPSLQFHFSELEQKGQFLKQRYKTGKVTITLPDEIVFSYDPTNVEKISANEFFNRFNRKRVLTEQCACSNCVEYSKKSILNIRTAFEDIRVKVNDINSPLYLLSEYADSAICEFLNFIEEHPPITKQSKGDYHDAMDILRPFLLEIFQAIYHIAGLKKDSGFYQYDEKRLTMHNHIILINEYNSEEKIRELYTALRDKGYIVSGILKDFMGLFNGEWVNPIGWRANEHGGGYRELLFFIVLLYVLTVDEPKLLKKTKIIKTKIIAELLNRFQIAGEPSLDEETIRSMQSTAKGYIVGKGYDSTTYVPKSKIELIEIVKAVFSIEYPIPYET